MTNEPIGSVAIIYPGDRETRRHATPNNNRLTPIFKALSDLQIRAEPAVYHDLFCEKVHRQVLQADAEQVTISLKEASRRLPEILGALGQGGGEIRETTLTQPSLESLFIKLTGKELRE